VKTTLEKRLTAIGVAAAGGHPQLIKIPEWLSWATSGELMQLEECYRRAEEAGEDGPGEIDQHRMMAIYSAAMARMLDAPPEARADPAARDAHVRAIEDRDKRDAR
jgi:hypothetical protein